MNPRCKIGKIKFKNGAEIRVIDTVQPHSDTVMILRDMLRNAEAGEVMSVAIATVNRNGWTDNCYTVCKGHHDYLLAGSVERLKHRIIRGDDR